MIEKINYDNRIKMKSEIRTDLNFKWQDNNLMQILLKKFKNVYHYQNDPERFLKKKDCLDELNKIINKFNKKDISEDVFKRNLEKELKNIIEEFPEVSFRNEYNYDDYIYKLALANRLLIYGDGGIGKSYFIYKLEEELEKTNIKHLCLYGKYTKEIPQEIMECILNVKEEFYFIFDAINELDDKQINDIIIFLKKILDKENINIIITYRTHNLPEMIESEIKKIIINDYQFRGVDYEQSLMKLIETYGIEITKYIGILETNNPLYIKMIYTVLNGTGKSSQKKRKKKKYELNGIGDLVQITSLLENYIKLICGNEYWEMTKKISAYMFKIGSSSITYLEVEKILMDNTEKYIKKMCSENLLDYYFHDNEEQYIFKIQQMSDYLIARHLNYEIENLDSKQIVDLINNKLSSLYTLSEAFIILLMDKYKEKNLKKGLDIIYNSYLKDSFDLSIFRKLNFNGKQIELIQKYITISDWNKAFLELGGYHDRPFNCQNYLNEILLNDENKIFELSIKYTSYDIVLKLKNTLYNIILIKNNNSYVEEMFWYSLWISSVPNIRIRKLATKLLFDITDKFNIYESKLVEVYKKVKEIYIKRTIIHVLTSLSDLSDETVVFLKNEYKRFDLIDSEIIGRIDEFLNLKKSYITLTKKNIYNEKRAVNCSYDLNRILMIADLHEKNVLKFDRFNSDNKLGLYENFLLYPKEKIRDWNEQLGIKFSCIEDNGFCKYWASSSKIEKFMPKLNKDNIIASEEMFIMFKMVFKEICEMYNYEFKDDRFDEHFNPFKDSILKKCLLITQDFVLGSLMCNYYTNDIFIYNDEETLGYSVYNTNKYEEEFRVCSPVSLYCEDVDRLNNKIEKAIDLYGNKDKDWYENENLSIENIQKMIQPISYNGHLWNLISAEIHLFVSNQNFKHLHTETYDLTISVDSQYNLENNTDARNLTIDKEKYLKNIKEYKKVDSCKTVDILSVEYTSDDFKNTSLSFPASVIINEFDLIYSKDLSVWKNKNNEIIIYCDNNNRNYSEPIQNTIYIRNDYLKKIVQNHKLCYWAYTEKSYLDYGWNEKASVHIELDVNGNVIAKYANNSLNNVEKEYNKLCKKCSYNIYREQSNNNDLLNSLLKDYYTISDEEEY